MAFAVGIILFGLGIAISIALHEAGHMYAARWTGMRVRRYFIGFGPTLWSTTKHSAKHGPTEYGLKAVPLGGFCDIAGMTKLDEMTEEERPYAMYDRPARSRIFVMLGGIIMNIILALGLIYAVALAWGLPDRSVQFTPTVDSTACAAPHQNPDGTLAKCSGTGPAAESGIRSGDTFVRIDGDEVPDFPTFSKKVSALGKQAHEDQGKQAGEAITVPAEVRRGEQNVPVNLKIQLVERRNTAGNTMVVGAVGVKAKDPEYRVKHYNPATAVGGTLSFTGMAVQETAKGLVELPQRFPGVVASIFGGDRADDSPMSVVGASRLGGELVKYDQWASFFMALASLNLFLAAFNLVPLPPLDGGHIAVVLWEKVRDFFRRRKGLAPGGPADYTRLMPVTYAATLVLLLFGLTVIVADVVNPIRLF